MTDTERLDWLEANDASISRSLQPEDAHDPFEVGNLLGYSRGRTLRMAIDGAIAIAAERASAEPTAPRPSWYYPGVADVRDQLRNAR